MVIVEYEEIVGCDDVDVLVEGFVLEFVVFEGLFWEVVDFVEEVYDVIFGVVGVMFFVGELLIGIFFRIWCWRLVYYFFVFYYRSLGVDIVSYDGRISRVVVVFGFYS